MGLGDNSTLEENGGGTFSRKTNPRVSISASISSQKLGDGDNPYLYFKDTPA
jgi:hypothetical protein